MASLVRRAGSMRAAVALLLTAAAGAIEVPHSLLGKRALLVAGALPFERRRALLLADAALSQGASVRLLMPLPASGEATTDEAALRLIQHNARSGFPRLMEEMGFHWGIPGIYGTGTRARVDFVHCRADDVELLALELADTDLLLVLTPTQRLDDDRLERARWRVQRRTYGYVVRKLRRSGVRLSRGESRRKPGDSGDRAGGVGIIEHRWAWLSDASDSARSEGRPDADAS